MVSSFVAGGADFIGSHIAEHLVDLGRRVVVLDDLRGRSKECPDQEAFSGRIPLAYAVRIRSTQNLMHCSGLQKFEKGLAYYEDVIIR
jgi:nucleoside-diphosphate-sugar epimerase